MSITLWKIVFNKLETETVKTLRLKKIGSEEFSFKAGQFIGLYLVNEDETFGQHKFYTISSTPDDKEYIELSYKLHKDFTTKLWKLREGNKLGVSKPFGVFIANDIPKDKPTAFIGGGIGITPLYSMIKWALNNNYKEQLTLFYSNRQNNNIPFKESLSNLEKKHSNFKVVHCITREEPKENFEKGYISEEILKKYLGNIHNWHYKICGTTRMVDSVRELLKKMNIEDSQVKFEGFG